MNNLKNEYNTLLNDPNYVMTDNDFKATVQTAIYAVALDQQLHLQSQCADPKDVVDVMLGSLGSNEQQALMANYLGLAASLNPTIDWMDSEYKSFLDFMFDANCSYDNLHENFITSEFPDSPSIIITDDDEVDQVLFPAVYSCHSFFPMLVIGEKTFNASVSRDIEFIEYQPGTWFGYKNFSFCISAEYFVTTLPGEAFCTVQNELANAFNNAMTLLVFTIGFDRTYRESTAQQDIDIFLDIFLRDELTSRFPLSDDNFILTVSIDKSQALPLILGDLTEDCCS